MNWKLPALGILTLTALWNLFLRITEMRSVNNPTPKNVEDVYDEETYARWKDYQREKSRLSIVSLLVSFAVSFLMLACNVYAMVSVFTAGRPYLAAFAVTLLELLVGTLVDIPAEYVNAMVIDEKYGFNRQDRKTFTVDRIKDFIISLLLEIGLLSLFIFLYRKLGDTMVFVFAGCLFLFILAVAFLSPFLMKIFNKFTPLEDGELRRALTAMMEKNGYRVRAINVMDASKRTTKANAGFTGFGKSKTIILYDTLLTAMEPREICAVFAHELGHGLHRDTLRNQILSVIQICCIAVLAWLTVRSPALYGSFGFSEVNYGFAIILMAAVELPLFTPLFGLLTNGRSRRAEYRADRQAVLEGYGDALVSALKTLGKENFSNLSPSRINVRLEYSHPPLSDRIAAIESYRE